ncbi:MAG TPA: hypothetical protein VEG30_01390 [Terriglobales bacterium]|nr:hypothetical protein [Terriglobales bacterium]
MPAPASTPLTQPSSVSPAPPLGAGPLNWSDALPGALIAGVLIGLSWIVPFSTFCLWILAGGALGVALYRRRNPGQEVTAGMGAKVGAVAGLFAWVIFAVLTALQLLVTRKTGQFRDMVQKVVEESATRNADPQVQQMLQRLLSPEGLATMVTLAMVMFLFAFVIFSAVGGALGAALLGGRKNSN